MTERKTVLFEKNQKDGRLIAGVNDWRAVDKLLDWIEDRDPKPVGLVVDIDPSEDEELPFGWQEIELGDGLEVIRQEEGGFYSERPSDRIDSEALDKSDD